MFFSAEDYTLLEQPQLGPSLAAQQRLDALHHRVYPTLRTYNLNLVVHKRPGGSIIHQQQAHGETALCIRYMRAYSEAVAVERLMGREIDFAPENVETTRHPNLTLRLTPTHFVVELVITSDAWWDQQNLVGKLSIERCRDEFYDLLARQHKSTCLGFWQGSYLSDMHLKGAFFSRRALLAEWLSTFEPGQDCFRLGRWYPPTASSLAQDQIYSEVVTQLRELYAVYEYIAWTGNNNFRNFYSAGRR